MSDCYYILEKNNNLMFDFFAFLNAVQKIDNYKDIGIKHDFQYDDKISDAYYRLYISNSRVNSGVAIFFSESPERGMSFFDWMLRKNADSFSSCDDIINEIEKYDSSVMVCNAMKFYDPYNNFQDKFYRDIIASADLFLEYMNGLNVSTEIRWNLMNFIQRPEETIESLKAYIKSIFDEFSAEYKNFTKQISNLNKFLEDSINNSTIDAAVIDFEISEKQKETNMHVLPDSVTPPTKEVKIIGLLFAPSTIMKINTSKGLYYAIGTGYMEYYNNSLSLNSTEDTLGEIFKAFTDGTRIQIIELLRQKECYNGELSQMLEVPMSSLTHHMEILNNCGFVIRRNAGKRTYYKLNKQQFLNAAALLRKYVEGYDI